MKSLSFLIDTDWVIDHLNAVAEVTRHLKELSRINQMNLVDMKPLTEKLKELTNEEMRLNHFVTGASYTNEFGLVIPPRKPL